MRARLGSPRARAIAAALVGVVLLGACRTDGGGDAAPPDSSAVGKPAGPSTTLLGQNGCRNVSLAAVAPAFPSLANASLKVGGPGVCFVRIAGAERTLVILTDVASRWREQAAQPGWRVLRVGAFEVGTSHSALFDIGGPVSDVTDVWVHNDRYSVRVSAQAGTAPFRQLQSPAGARQAAGVAIAVLAAVTKNG
jgi:hypothetical protein